MLTERLQQVLKRLKTVFSPTGQPGEPDPTPEPTQPPAQVVGCSVTGEKHEHNEDAWSAHTPTDETIAIAVGDGLGSKTHSRAGSAAATTAAVDELTATLASGGTVTRDSMAEQMPAAFAAARTAVERQATDLGAPVEECATTLLTVAGDRSGIAAAAVGDGGVVGADDGEHFSVVEREASEYASVTTPLTAAGWRDAYRFGYTDRADAVAVFTDGLSSFTWERAGDATPETAFFEQVFPPVQAARRAADVEPALCAFLEDSHFSRHSRDDKTLVVGVPVPRRSTRTTTASAGETEPTPVSTPTGGTDR